MRQTGQANAITLRNRALAWRFRNDDSEAVTEAFAAARASTEYTVSGVSELALTFSAASDQIMEPYQRVDGWALRSITRMGRTALVLHLAAEAPAVRVALHIELDGSTRRKWAEVTNASERPLLLLDVDLDAFTVDAPLRGGGPGMPAFLGGEGFAAIEHPAGIAVVEGEVLRLGHHPGVRIEPGETYRTRTAIVSLAPPGVSVEEHFVAYLEARCRRQRRLQGVYTPFGINNQWGACPALSDEEILHVLGLLAGWRRKGAGFDYFTLDTGWADPASDQTRFRPIAFPNGPEQIVEGIHALGMRFGLWFPLGWGTQSCWDYEPAYPDGAPPGLPYREGYPITVGGITFCLGDDRYHDILRNAVLHHVRENGVRFIKFDGGLGACDDPTHAHLPGVYGQEAMFDRLIAIADAARSIAPDTFVMWYWGLRSPFWALHGDTIFESGLHMEGSGTSSTPTLYYRDSVTLAQDQNAQYARLIPPACKDSLGVWLADTRWGNFMGKERWREALVMDLGRGSLLWPNLWGDLYLLDGDDVAFLRDLTRFARRHERLLAGRRHVIGDSWADEPYGYAYGRGDRAIVFLNNVHFAARPVTLRLDGSLGLKAEPVRELRVVERFPEDGASVRPDGQPTGAGGELTVWLRPFETLLLEIGPPRGEEGAVRAVTAAEAADLGHPLVLRSAVHAPRLEVRMADAARFEAQGLRPRRYSYIATIPALDGPQPILAIPVRLRAGDEEWRYAPKPVEIVQVMAQVDGHNVMLAPVPDGRQHGNTQHAGCSWVLYRTRMPRDWAGKTLQISVHAYLPEQVEARTEAWIVKRWWREDARPAPDGYYTDAPS